MFPRKEVPFGGYNDRWRRFGKICHQNPISWVGFHYHKPNPTWLTAAILKSLWRHNSAVDDPIPMTFGTPMENHMPMTIKKPKSKPEVEFQYVFICFQKPEVVISRPLNWDIWSKFGMPIALDLLKCQLWLNEKPEVHLRRYGRHLVKSIWRHNSVVDLLIRIKFGRPKSKQGVEFKYGERMFSATESSISAVDLNIWSKFGMPIVLCLPNSRLIKPESRSRFATAWLPSWKIYIASSPNADAAFVGWPKYCTTRIESLLSVSRNSVRFQSPIWLTLVDAIHTFLFSLCCVAAFCLLLNKRISVMMMMMMMTDKMRPSSRSVSSE